MSKKTESGEGEGLRVFGRPAHRRRTRPASYWLKAGLLAFIGVLNLLAAAGLLAAGVFLLTSDKVEADNALPELRVGVFSIPLRADRAEGRDFSGATRQQGREVLAAVCIALSLVPFSLAVLARMQYQVYKEMSLLPLTPAGSEQQKE